MSKLQTVILGVAIALYAGWRVNMIAKAYRKQRAATRRSETIGSAREYKYSTPLEISFRVFLPWPPCAASQVVLPKIPSLLLARPLQISVGYRLQQAKLIHREVVL